MSTDIRTHQCGRLSLVSVTLTAMAITVNHLYTIGPAAYALGAILVVLPAALLLWFNRTAGRIAFVGYVLMSVWIVVGFGAMKGFWGTALRLFLGTFLSRLSASFPKPPIGTLGFELSGMLTFIGGLFVLYYAYKLVEAQRVVTHTRARLAISAVLIAATMVGAYVYNDRDKWVAPRNGVVKIGVIVPTTGPYAILGNSFVKAVEMAKEDLKDTKYRYELVIRDSGPDPIKAKDAIQKMIAEDKIDAIVGGISLIGQMTKPYARAARIPHLCVCTVTSIGDGAYNFTNIPSPQAEGALWVREAKRRGIERFALITQDYPSINNHVKALKTEAARAGLVVADEQTFEADITDFRPTISRAEASRPDVYYVEALNPGLDRLAQQLSDAGVHNVASVVAPSLSERPDLFEGAWYTDSNLRELAFKKRFEDKYPGTRFATHMMPYAYDSVNMIVAAFERGENPAVYLRNMQTYEGTAGTLMKEPSSGNFGSTPAVWVIKDGKPMLMH